MELTAFFLGMKHNYLKILLLLVVCGCSESDGPTGFWENYTPFQSRHSIQEMELIDFFSEEGVSKGVPSIVQASGLAYSRNNPGYLWSHQDKNFDNSIYLIDENTGQTVATYRIKGTTNRDWEDIEIASGPIDGLNYLYIGDVGDNDQKYPNYWVYRFEEPRFEEKHRDQIIELEIPFDKISFKYPNRSYDVEALMVDPLTKDIYLVTKRNLWSILYVLLYPQKTDEEISAIKAGTFSFRFVTAGTVSNSGDEVLIKNYDRIFYWKREKQQTFLDMMASKPFLAPYNPKEVQGEAICFDNKNGYFTLSEFSDGVQPHLFHYERLK